MVNLDGEKIFPYGGFTSPSIVATTRSRPSAKSSRCSEDECTGNKVKVRTVESIRRFLITNS